MQEDNQSSSSNLANHRRALPPLNLSVLNNTKDEDAPPQAPRGNNGPQFDNSNTTQQAMPAAFENVSGEVTLGLSGHAHFCFSS